MLEFSGSIDRTFSFPASQADSFEFFSDYKRTIALITQIEIAQISPSNPHLLRLSYESNEMGAYLVQVYCDVAVEIDSLKNTVQMIPTQVPEFSKVKPALTATRTTSTGDLNATLTCLADGPETSMIRYQYSLHSAVPVTGVMRFVPLGPIKEMVQNLISNRLDAQVDQFIKKSVQRYAQSQEEQNQ